MSVYGKFTPPNVSGLWLLTERYTLIQEQGDKEVTLDDIIHPEDLNIRFEQKKEFVIWKFLETSELIPEIHNRAGVWKPTLVNCKPISWELLLADYDDSNIGYIQVLETDNCGKPIKLWANFVESYSSPNDPLQTQAVTRSVLIRKE